MTKNRPSANGSKSGFTLVEMLVATVLASVVLLGLFNLVTNMVQSEVKSSRTGTVAAWAATAVNAMSSDIAGASMISYPAVGASSDYLIVCSNWSSKASTSGGGATLHGGSPSSQQYCFDTTDAAPNGNTILRMTPPPASCPAGPVTPSTVANYGGTRAVIATGVYRSGANPVFFTDNKTLNAVRIRMSIGQPTANTSSAGSGGSILATPVTTPIDTEIILED